MGFILVAQAFQPVRAELRAHRLESLCHEEKTHAPEPPGLLSDCRRRGPVYDTCSAPGPAQLSGTPDHPRRCAAVNANSPRRPRCEPRSAYQKPHRTAGVTFLTVQASSLRLALAI